MAISRNTLLTAIFAFATLAVVANDSNACGGRRSNRYSSSSVRSYSVPSVSYGNYHRASPTYSYATPTYSQHVQAVRPVQQAIAPPPAFTQSVPQQPVQLQTVQPVSQSQLVAQPQFAPTQQPVSPQQSVQIAGPAPANAVQMSALQALGGFAPPLPTSVQSQPQPVQTPVHVGNWTATLGNGATVQLTLQADGSFSWVATNQTGSASSFSGQYAATNGSLNLTRANDNQQLAGSMNITDTNAFSFTLAGSNAAAISFSRN